MSLLDIKEVEVVELNKTISTQEEHITILQDQVNERESLLLVKLKNLGFNLKWI